MTTAHSEWVRRRPAAALTPYIDSYIGYRLTGFPPGLHRGLPSRHMTFIVSIGPRIDVVAQADPSQSPDRYRTVVGGLHSSAALIAHHGHQEGVAVVLSPLGSRSFFGMPARALSNTSVELAEVVGTLGDELWERIQLSEGWDQRVGVMDTMLSALLKPTERVPAEVSYTWKRLVASAGVATVSELADSVGWSRQHLTRRFREELGMSPKVTARVLRFGKAVHMIESASSRVSLAEVAMTCGYSDQAHMTRDFGILAGCPPGRLLDGEVPKFQDSVEVRA